MEDSCKSNDADSPADESVGPNSKTQAPVLPSLGILVGLGNRSLTNLAEFGRYDQFPAGTRLIREGEVQNRFFVVVDGQLAVSIHSCGRELPLGMAEAGECLGEVSLLDPGPASASIQVVEDATLWSMDVDELRDYLQAHMGDAGILLMGMASCLSNRLRKANRLISQHHVVPTQTLPHSRERAITAANTPLTLGFFERIKKSLVSEKDKKIRISMKIKM